MRDALLVARVEFLRRLRNRSALFTAFVGPLVLAIVFGVIMGGTASVSISIGLVDLDRSEISNDFIAALTDAEPDPGASDAGNPVSFQIIDAGTARDAVDDGEVDAAIVIPSGFGEATVSGPSVPIEVLRDPTGQVAGAIAESIARQFTLGIANQGLLFATAFSNGVALDATDPELQSSLFRGVRTEGPGGTSLDATAFYGVAMSILFLFFTASFAARSLIAEKRTGLVGRMLATATAPASILVGKVLAIAALGLSGFVTVWLATELIFGASWGNPIAVLITMCATVTAISGVAMFVCGLARTELQADSYASIAAFALALLGGNFVGPGQAPDALERVAKLTPNGQAIDAFARIAADGAGVGDVIGQLAVLAGFAIVLGALGLVRIRRVIVS